MLVDHRRAEVALGSRPPDGLGQRRRRDQPAEAQPGGERLADRAEQHHPLRAEPLEAADRVAVVAELGVVVVLEHQPVHLGGPGDQLGPPPWRQDDPGGVLVGGRDQHHPGGAAAERADVDALVVDRDGQPDGAGRPQQGVGALAVRVLDGQGDRAGPGQGADDQVEALGDAVHHDQAAGRDVGGPDPAEVGRQLGRQLGDAAGVAVAQRLVGEHVQDLADRGQPGPAGEGREVGRAHPQVVADLVLDGRAGALPGRGPPAAAAGCRRPGCPSPGGRPRSPRRRAAGRPRRPRRGSSRGRGPGLGWPAAGCRRPAGPTGSRSAARRRPVRPGRRRPGRAAAGAPTIGPRFSTVDWPFSSDQYTA